MEIKKHELEVVVKRGRVILNITTLLKKGIKIQDPKRFMWTQTKQNNDKYVKNSCTPSTWKYVIHKTHLKVELLCSCILTS
jgi:hypothetical protein